MGAGLQLAGQHGGAEEGADQRGYGPQDKPVRQKAAQTVEADD